MSRLPVSLITACTVLCSSSWSAAHAQTVRGRTVDERGAPLPSSMVVLVDEEGRSKNGILSDDDGRFSLTAPYAGRWRVRAERVGQAGSMSPVLVLQIGDTASVAMTLGRAKTLAAVRVNARERCRVRPGEGSRAAALWEGVRQALQGATLAMETRRLAFSLERVERTRDAESRLVTGEVRTVDPTSTRLFESADPEDLQRRGWVRFTADTVGMLEFYGPDARVLLSDVFVEAHCLRVVDAPHSRAGQVGLAFEPLGKSRSTVPDIRGTLWLNEDTGELRELEFAFVGLSPSLERHDPGGRVAFGRLPTGTWFIESWQMRMPAYERPWPGEPHVFAGMREVGGRTLLDGDLPEVAPDVALITGMVVDSTQDFAPVTGARVEVAGTGYTAVTNTYGGYRLEVPARDSVRLIVRHPRVIALGTPAQLTVPVALGRESVALLGLPSVMTVRRALCGTGADSAGGVVTGAFWDVRRSGDSAAVDYSRPMKRSRVTLAWAKNGEAKWGLTTPVESRRLTTDQFGHFFACGVPAGARVRVQADVGFGERDREASFSSRTQTWWLDVPPRGAVVLQMARGADWFRQQQAGDLLTGPSARPPSQP